MPDTSAISPVTVSLGGGLILDQDDFSMPPGAAVELQNCSSFFQREIHLLKNINVILALGKIGFDGCLKYFRNEFDLKLKDYPFGHDKKYKLPNGKILWGCYHPSPRNVNTGKLDKKMMRNFWMIWKLKKMKLLVLRKKNY